MTRVEALEREIERLSPGELAELRAWFFERDWEAWDRQIEHDSASGKLDELFREAEAEHRAGRSTRL